MSAKLTELILIGGIIDRLENDSDTLLYIFLVIGLIIYDPGWQNFMLEWYNDTVLLASYKDEATLLMGELLLSVYR